MDIKSLTAWLSLGVATIALILSQLPPIPSYFSLPKLNLTAHSSLQIRHNFGDLVLVPFLQISNSGNAQGMVSKIELILTRKDKPSYRKHLLAQTYSPKPGTIAPYQAPVVIPFGHISVLPKETWATYISFYETPNTAWQIKTANIHARVAADIRKSWSENLSTHVHESPKISNQLFDEIKNLTDERLSSFEIGQYRLHLKLFGGNNSKPIAHKCYSLAVFDGHLSQLDAITEQYRFGTVIGFTHSFIPFSPQLGFVSELSDVECAT